MVAGRTGFEEEGGSLEVRGVWVATYEWWASTLNKPAIGSGQGVSRLTAPATDLSPFEGKKS